MNIDPFIEAEKQAGHSTKRVCELLKVSRAAFYSRRIGIPGARALRDAELSGRISEVHQASRGTYGAPRVHAALKREGTDLSRWSSTDLEAVAMAINNRPRKILGWRTPAEAFEEQLRSLQQPGVATTG
ncbi:IS3 family transposase [Streptomyces sp. NPDC006990]|uniref:IS3 family transposase n=1 Tax=unclassified Streptomyces TaxID=2593676 RepID=UPI003452F7D5